MSDDSLTGRIKRVLNWGKHLNADDGPLKHSEAMEEILRLAIRLEDELVKKRKEVQRLESRLELERYRNQGIKPWGRSRR